MINVISRASVRVLISNGDEITTATITYCVDDNNTISVVYCVRVRGKRVVNGLVYITIINHGPADCKPLIIITHAYGIRDVGSVVGP